METGDFSKTQGQNRPSKLQKLKISETPPTNVAEKTPKKYPAVAMIDKQYIYICYAFVHERC